MKSHIAIFLASSVWMMVGCTKEEVPTKSIIEFGVTCYECNVVWSTTDQSKSIHVEGFGYWTTSGNSGSTATIRCEQIEPDPSGAGLFIWSNGADIGFIDGGDIGNPTVVELSVVIP